MIVEDYSDTKKILNFYSIVFTVLIVIMIAEDYSDTKQS